MDRLELLRGFVLEVVADDYEDLEKIYAEVSGLGSRCGVSIPHSEILQAVIDLIETGLAKAYDLRGSRAEEIQGATETFELHHPYFLITPKGRGVHSNGDWWPFDEEGSVRNDWVAPNK